ncbi:MAG TPA: isochorismatase family protein [Candidatus Aquilonibacter sp.]|nr:isochorismatase family protein [Candidatus Aquilonibacter sp.]
MNEAALLVIDVQDSFKRRPSWAQRSFAHTFEPAVTRLIAAFRDAGRPVIYVMHSDGDEAFAFDGPDYRLMSFLDRRDDEPIIHKTTANALTSTPLLPLLLARGIRRLVVTGIQTEQCCETTSRVAADLGFAVDFVTEATMTFPIAENADGTGRILSTQDIIERTEFALRRRFARIATVDDVVREVREPVAV